MDDGLPHYTVTAIAQTRDGYLWIGTKDGLACFDGVRFTPFDFNLSEEAITALCEGSDGSLWIGTDGAGVFRLQQGKLSRFSEADGLRDNHIRALLQTRDGSLWIGSNGGINISKGGKLLSRPAEETWAAEPIRSLSEDQAGNVWIGNIRQFIRFKNEEFSSFAFLSGDLRTVFRAHDGMLWLASGRGLYQMLGEKLMRHPVTNGLPSSIISVSEDRFGNFWFWGYGGLGRLNNTAAEKGAGVVEMELDTEDASFGRVYAFCEDREGNIWIGSETGLHRLSSRQFTAYDRQTGLQLNNVTCVLEDRSASVWVGTWGGGLHRMPVNGKPSFENEKKLPSGFVMALHEGRDGTIWAGLHYPPRLAHWASGHWEFFEKIDGLQHPNVKVIHEDQRGNLWLGTGTGLNVLTNGTFSVFTKNEGLSDDDVRDICETPNGDVWFATANGLSRWRNGKFDHFSTAKGLSKNSLLSLFSDHEGSLWIGTKGGGLNCLSNGCFTFVTSQQGLFSDSIYGMAEDNRGDLWMSGGKGIFRVAKKEIQKVMRGEASAVVSFDYGKPDGLPSGQFNGGAQPAVWKGADGRIWFATIKGVVVVDPNKISTNEKPPSVVIEEVVADKKRIQESGILEKGKRREGEKEKSPFPLFSSAPFLVPVGHGELEIHYTALSLTAPEKNRFKYKLAGVDSDWVDADGRRVAYYNNLKPGTYTFRVIASNNDGVWNSVGSSITLRMLPHFWQTWWFLGICGIAATGVVGGTARYVTKTKMQRKLKETEQRHALERERSRIAQDMHDDLGARLTEIMFLSGTAQDSNNGVPEIKTQVGKIETAARDLVQNLDAIVWAVDPQNDTLSDLAAYIHDYADRFLTNSGIRGRFQVQRELESRAIPSKVRHNLFLVVKEALNNAVRHSECSEVQFQLSFENNTLVVSIFDNGKGFDRDGVSDPGNGLENMEDRVRKIGGCFELGSQPGKGTRIQLQIAIPE